jgi:uncharacterized membrane protein
MSLLPPEIAIAVILVVVALVVLLISRMGLLPSKSLPYVAGALLAVFGLAIANRLRAKGIRDEAEKRRKALGDFAKKAAVDGESADAAAARAAQAEAEARRQEEAAAKTIELLHAKTEEQEREIDNLHGDELHRRLDEAGARLMAGGG